MENFKGNSDASKELPKKRVQAVTSNVVVKSQSSESSKPARKFFAEDAKSVGGHVVESIIIPSAQRLLSDVVKGAIDWLIFGSKGASRSGPGTISYGSYFNRSGLVNTSPISYNQPQIMPRPTPTLYQVNDIVINDREAVEEVLIRMREMINAYGMVSVGDFYDLVSVRANFTDYKWGWFDLSKVDVIRVDDGFCIRFPKIQPIEK